VTGLGFFMVPLVAVLAPLLARGIGRWLPVPIVVFELVLGIVIGPSVLDVAGPSDFVDLLSSAGLAVLFFVAGSEIEFASFRGRTGRRAIGGWVVSLVAGVVVGWLVSPGAAAVVIGIALCSTALGTILPILRDAGVLKTPFGRTVAVIGAVGEFGPLVAISLFLGGRGFGTATIVLLVFVVIAAVAILSAFVLPQGALHRVVSATLHTSGQFAVRLFLLIIAVLVGLSVILGLDMLLGAFVAGIVWQLLMRDAAPADREAVESKVEAVAFGFLVPIFFVYTGVTFDLASLLAQPILFALLPVVVVVLVVVRGLPSALAAPTGSGFRDRAAIALLGATGLPIIVAVTSIGVDAGVLPSAAASVLVGGGMLSVLVLPLVAMALRRDRIEMAGDVIDERF
jgi:Kef-type K+ transport system membrane component KefB